MAVPAIQAEGLVKRFGDLVAVDGCSFVVREGEVFGFLGPNGAGKTSTMRMIACVSPKSGGRLRVFGLDVDRYPREIKAQIGVVSQENNLDPDLSVFDNLVVFARFFEIDRTEAARRAEELIDFFSLREKRDTPIEYLSGGMKRRLTIARALINRPRLVILDEPTTGLDPQARSLIWERLRALRDRGSTVLLSTHYLEEAERFCDRLVIMDRGKILVEGRPDEIVSARMNRFVVETTATPEVIALLEREGIGYERFGDLVHITVDAAEPLVQRLVSECSPARLHVRSATLEDVFLRLTGRGLKD
ncbi:MAG TPA: ABC transporter ATP-binding protein [Methanoregulaceae archaeon]|nr:ABC transporter ATP-binding protein [Methanoregulaceae archaeon]HOV67969.1 ABC transporter ATP-binding protein [Methanoregulaceae archaeon]HQJ87741.1 ABC transporter ATP-binding protein [Methanoregulaceae archaeon]